MQKTLGLVMFFAGILMLFVGSYVPMVVIGSDTTPPTWKLASDGSLAIGPKNGDILSNIYTIIAGVADPESGVSSVTVQVDSTTYTLTLKLGTANDGVWWYDTALSVPSGTHTIKYVATNNVGLSTTYTGSFQIYTALQGNWYVNDKLITDPSQEVWSSSSIFTFKFVKTAGIADSGITCSGWEGGVQKFTLTNTAANTWTGSYTFTLGKHTVDLKANDGTNTVTMSIFNLGVGEQPLELPKFNMIQTAGIALTVIGFLVLLFDKLRMIKIH
jgi:hypothetical protein